jgi:hypothetical protein
MPQVLALANADGSNVNLNQSIQSATVTLSKSEAKYESLSLYKNSTNVEGKVRVTIAFESWRAGFGNAIQVEALWSDQAVTPTHPVTVVAPNMEKGLLGRYTLQYDVLVKKGATHSLRLKYKLPVGVSGIDREERLVGYRVVDIKQSDALSQFRFAVKYSPSIVFVPIESKPDWGWEVGSEGAYLKLDGKLSNRNSVLTFRYYPAGF